MKFNDVAFPHPVLGVSDAIEGMCHLFPEPTIKSEKDLYDITIYCQQDNEDLTTLIQNCSAEYVVEVTCSNTLFRKIFKSRSNIVNFQINKNQVKETVSFTCYLLAAKDISNYSNKNFHVDYDGFSFDIEKGDLLAFFGVFSFDADINYQKLKAVSSLMEVVENNEEGRTTTYIDLSKSKIEIQLPTADYANFSRDVISGNEKFVPVIHASIVLNALLVALYNYEANKSQLWAKAIEYRLKNEPEFENLLLEDKANVPEIAQMLLGNPFNRLMSGLQEITDDNDENYE